MKVSIIMPAYNVEEYVEESIVSIQHQKFEDWELIIIDDGSVDKTVCKIKFLMKDDSRIRLINQINQGVSIARNRGIDEAKGEYISFLDADDLWENDFLLEMIDAAEKNHTEMVLCGYKRLLENSKVKEVGKFFCVGDEALYYYATSELETHIGAILVKRELIVSRKLRFHEGCMLTEDVEFIYKCLGTLSASVVGKHLMIYRKRHGSATYGNWNEQRAYSGILALERIKILLENAAMMKSKLQLCLLKISTSSPTQLNIRVKVVQFNTRIRDVNCQWIFSE